MGYPEGKYVYALSHCATIEGHASTLEIDTID